MLAASTTRWRRPDCTASAWPGRASVCAPRRPRRSPRTTDESATWPDPFRPAHRTTLGACEVAGGRVSSTVAIATRLGCRESPAARALYGAPAPDTSRRSPRSGTSAPIARVSRAPRRPRSPTRRRGCSSRCRSPARSPSSQRPQPNAGASACAVVAPPARRPSRSQRALALRDEAGAPPVHAQSPTTHPRHPQTTTRRPEKTGRTKARFRSDATADATTIRRSMRQQPQSSVRRTPLTEELSATLIRPVLHASSGQRSDLRRMYSPCRGCSAGAVVATHLARPQLLAGTRVPEAPERQAPAPPIRSPDRHAIRRIDITRSATASRAAGRPGTLFAQRRGRWLGAADGGRVVRRRSS
jgi:hypothetical protein